MQTWIALLRGINVGGKNILPMAKLIEDLQSLNCKKIKTYIQSGNVVFDSATKNASSLSKKITARIQHQHGFEPYVLLLGRGEFQSTIDANPFPKATNDPKTLHFFFLAKPAVSPDIDALDTAKLNSENYLLTDRVFYLHAPDGVGRSKLAANVEKHLGVATTARNYRTVEKLSTMVTSDS